MTFELEKRNDHLLHISFYFASLIFLVLRFTGVFLCISERIRIQVWTHNYHPHIHNLSKCTKDKKEIGGSSSQTLHTIEKVIVPARLPYVSRSGAKKKLDIALIKLGKL